jgi:hypothetical protein
MRIFIKMYLLVISLNFPLISFAQFRGCSAKTSFENAEPLSKYTLYSTSGNQIIDNATIKELTSLNNAFGVLPNFFFYDDANENNAKSSDQVTNFARPDGTIIFGKRFFNRQFLRPNGSTAIPIIIAHEYAHLVDFKYGILNRVSAKKRELFCDYLAGIYMSIRIRTLGFVDINAAYTVFSSMGDTDFGNVDHHGTAGERSSALLTGYKEAEARLSIGLGISLDNAIHLSEDYIKSIPEEGGGIIPD